MYLRRAVALALVASVLPGALLAGRARAAGEFAWLRVTSPNFVVYSDAGEERARSIADQLEAFRALLLSVFPSGRGAEVDPLVVIAFRNDEEFTPFKPLYEGKPTSRSGVFLPSRERSLVILNASAYNSSSRVIFHEYTHRVVALRETPVPLWLNEGLAELYSTARADGPTAEIGAPIDAHVRHLRRELVPLEELFAVTPESPEYNELSKQSGFYAQSWAFVHYWMLEQGAAGRKRLENFAERLGRGEPSRAAFPAAFGVDMATAEKALKEYVGGSLAAREFASFEPAGAGTDVCVEAAPEAELESHFGLVLALEQRYADAERYFRRAQGLDPTLSLPYEGLGLVAFLQGKLEEARAAFGEAIKRDSQSYRAHYYFANASIQLDDAPTDAPVREALERAVALNPSYPEPYHLLSLIARRGTDYAGALAWAERGIAAAPQDGEVRLMLGFAQIANRQFGPARANLRHVLGTEENAAVRRSASVALASLDRYTSAIERATVVLSPLTPSTTAPPTRVAEVASTRLDLPLGVLDELPNFLHLASAGVRGRLVRIECVGRAMTAYLRVGDRTLVYSTPRSEQVVFFTLNHSSVETIPCDEQIDREAIIELEPNSRDRDGGLLKAIVFLTPARRSAS